MTFPLPFGLDHVHCYLLRRRAAADCSSTPGLGTREPRGAVAAGARRARRADRADRRHAHASRSRRRRARRRRRSRAPRSLRAGRTTRSASPSGAAAIGGAMRSYWVATRNAATRSAGRSSSESGRLADAVHWVEARSCSRPATSSTAGASSCSAATPTATSCLDPRRRADRRRRRSWAGSRPTIGLYPNSRPDPLADYFETLARIEQIAPRVAYSGHEDPVLDPAGRAREIRAHHLERLQRTIAALGPEPLSAYDGFARVVRGAAVAAAAALRDRGVARAPRAARTRGAVARADGGFVLA